jgi:hypothetical protein
VCKQLGNSNSNKIPEAFILILGCISSFSYRTRTSEIFNGSVDFAAFLNSATGLGEILPFWPKFLTLAEIFDVGRNF